MRSATVLILTTVLLAGPGYADEPPTEPSASPFTTPADRAAQRTEFKQRRDAWRQLTPQQRQARLQAGKSRAQKNLSSQSAQ